MGPVRSLKYSSVVKHPSPDAALGSPCLVWVVHRLVNAKNLNLGRCTPKINSKLFLLSPPCGLNRGYWGEGRRLDLKGYFGIDLKMIKIWLCFSLISELCIEG